MSEQDILDGLEIDAVNTEAEADPDRDAMRKKYMLQLEELSYKFKKTTASKKTIKNIYMILLKALSYESLYYFKGDFYVRNSDRCFQVD